MNKKRTINHGGSLQTITENNDSSGFFKHCIKTGHNPEDPVQKNLIERHLADLLSEKRYYEELKKDPRINPRQKEKNPIKDKEKYLIRNQCHGQVILKCLGNYPPNNFLEDQQRFLERIKSPLGKMYSILNFSEVLAIIGSHEKLRESSYIKNGLIYEALNEVKIDFFNHLGDIYKVNQKSIVFENLDVFPKENLEERLLYIPQKTKQDFERSVLSTNKIKVTTEVPKFKAKGQGHVYKKIRASEISSTINEFERKYLIKLTNLNS